MADDVLDADLGGLFFALFEELGHLAPVDFGEGGFALLDHTETGDGELEGDFEFCLGGGLAGVVGGVEEGGGGGGEGRRGYNDGGWRGHSETGADEQGIGQSR